jgi:hypothetical protein
LMTRGRFSVVGSTGSGKTHLARLVADRLDLPHYELDAIRRDAGGREVTGPEFVKRVAAVADQDSWIIDGHYRDVRQLIWNRAETVVLLNYPLPVVAFRLLGRFWRKQRSPDAVSPTSRAATPGEMPAPPVAATWRHRLGRFKRTLQERREYGRLLRAPGHEFSVVELRSVRDTNRWLEGLGSGQSADPVLSRQGSPSPVSAAV